MHYSGRKLSGLEATPPRCPRALICCGARSAGSQRDGMLTVPVRNLKQPRALKMTRLLKSQWPQASCLRRVLVKVCLQTSVLRFWSASLRCRSRLPRKAGWFASPIKRIRLPKHFDFWEFGCETSGEAGRSRKCLLRAPSRKRARVRSLPTLRAPSLKLPTKTYC